MCAHSRLRMPSGSYTGALGTSRRPAYQTERFPAWHQLVDTD